jgi:hypothetical protein
MRPPGSWTTFVAVALALVIATGDPTGTSAIGGARPAPGASAIASPGDLPVGAVPMAAVQRPSDSCNPNTGLMSVSVAAKHLMADRYKLGNHPLVKLRHDLTWAEDPLHDVNWRERFQMLRFVMALMIEWKDSGSRSYRDRAIALVRSWIARNPRSHPASRYSWGDHATAWRTMTLVCMARMLPRTQWLVEAIRIHGAVLADPGFYVGWGNHGLNQAIGLLDAGCYLGRTDWAALAAHRIGRLVADNIDTQGVSNEQAIRYDLYDYVRFTAARDHLLACGYRVPPDFERVLRMPDFLAQATRPDGRYETIGDTTDRPATPIAGTPAQFTATLGKLGPKPSAEVAIFRRAYAFGRTGWGEDRSYTDEAFFSLSFGRGMALHGHDDGGSVTLYGYGAQMLVDPGYGDYNGSIWSAFFASRRAHNTVVTAGLRSHATRDTALERSTIAPRSVDLVVRTRAYDGVLMRRRVIFSRQCGYLVVEDTIDSAVARTWRQLWHLGDGSRPVTEGRQTWTRRQRGNLFIQQLVGRGVTHQVLGEKDPLQGWISRSYGDHRPSPVIERSTSGRSVRFVTVLVPFEGEVRPVVSDIRLTRSGFSFVVDAGGCRERVRATATTVSITDAQWTGIIPADAQRPGAAPTSPSPTPPPTTK